MKNQELLREIIQEAYRKKYKDEETTGLYKTAINMMRHRTDISQNKVDILLNFLRGKSKEVIDMIDLYFKK